MVGKLARLTRGTEQETSKTSTPREGELFKMALYTKDQDLLKGKIGKPSSFSRETREVTNNSTQNYRQNNHRRGGKGNKNAR